MPQRLISFDLKADFGCMKKPDVNDGLMLTFNMLHKPALLGILGAIVGLKGYSKKGEFPEYYHEFKGLKVSIEPLSHDKGNFTKTVIRYTNSVGYANKNDEGAGATQIIDEQTLIAPAYRCYILLDTDQLKQAELRERLIKGESVYLPYIGKNEHSAWFFNDYTEGVGVVDYDTFKPFKPNSNFKVNSLFIRDYPLKDKRAKPKLLLSTQSIMNQSSFAYFERLPLRFDETLFQYELAEFAYADWFFKPDSVADDLFEIQKGNEIKVIQLY
jgi:CRISPR-associated protein Cas5h